MRNITPEKLEFFEQSTRRLLKIADGMPLNRLDRMNLKNTTLHIRDSMKVPSIHDNVFSQYADCDTFTYPSDGFCKAASYVAHHLNLGGGGGGGPPPVLVKI
ncbi:MAG: hypothetical protein LBO08_01965 [Rickettsiales bacterium]|jgi:hypothetical protein|nr:hypothetical protein [Rickettsiales bacterium]